MSSAIKSDTLSLTTSCKTFPNCTNLFPPQSLNPSKLPFQQTSLSSWSTFGNSATTSQTSYRLTSLSWKSWGPPSTISLPKTPKWECQLWKLLRDLTGQSRWKCVTLEKRVFICWIAWVHSWLKPFCKTSFPKMTMESQGKQVQCSATTKKVSRRCKYSQPSITPSKTRVSFGLKLRVLFSYFLSQKMRLASGQTTTKSTQFARSWLIWGPANFWRSFPLTRKSPSLRLWLTSCTKLSLLELV